MELVLGGDIRCIESEQAALLKFEGGFISPSNHFVSWTAEDDCCKWRGVGCDNLTGHVISLDLHSSNTYDNLHGELSPSLLDLPYLSYLDLSLNDFRQNCVPEFLGYLSNLEYLNLSHASFRGTLPDSLGNISGLQYLDLSGNGFFLRVNNLDWLSGLTSLKVLDLSGVDLSNTNNWLDAINRLTSLVELKLVACQLHKLPSSLSHVNFTSLKVLDLSYNSFNSEIPQWLFDIGHSLVYLNLSRNQLQGAIPNAIGKMITLISLDLFHNNLTGPIPTMWGLDQEEGDKNLGHSSLRELRFSCNRLNGSLEKGLAQLSDLVVLDIASNSVEGVITEVHLQNFSKLRVLDLSSNHITLNVSSNRIPAFKLDVIGLRSCKVGVTFPKWLRTQKNFSSIDISRTNISGIVPDWFWDSSLEIKKVSMSNNNLTGKVPDLSERHALSTLDLSYKAFRGPLPHFPSNMRTIYLAGNLFSGPISSFCDIMTENNVLSYLDLSQNNLSGPLPNCWTHGRSLIVLNFGTNRLSGTIPDSIGHLTHLRTLILEDNILHGELPSLRKCTDLAVMDLSRNSLFGDIPSWIRENLINLMLFILRKNQFGGSIPLQLCQLQLILGLDLSMNNISGKIPRCIDNFLTMAGVEDVHFYIYNPYARHNEKHLVHLISEKSKLIQSYIESERVRLISHYREIDLSQNQLSGVIPEEIGSLIKLKFLNISGNHLTGTMPNTISALRELVALDLSRNQLSCSIPTGMADLYSLAVFDLSYNNLSGKIPAGKQLETFDSSSYIGNSNLCGFPLEKKCLRRESYEYQNCLDGKEKKKVLKVKTEMGLENLHST
ncbi:Leucine-rich receptor-like kinase family protein [Quillaja saponaria]|uniref:Leucine-rich receptor-like kinase family protein n=1 Tax=Quillaja saponaria TaxID=32244 RepID=A0AAD7M1A8_QUISA|nr:Leucine-rich receptor-like kinase family protein [Quillaja saponaria]